MGLRSPSLLLGGAAWSPASLGGGAAFTISYYFSTTCLLLGGAAFFHLLKVVLLGFLFLWVVLLFPSPLSCCCLPSPPLGGGAFSPLVCWVALLGFLPLGGVAVFLLLLVVLPSSPSCGWSCFFPLFNWVVLLGPPGWCCVVFPVVLPFFSWVGLFFPLWFSFSGWRCRFFCPSGGTTFHLSSVGWCCLVHSSLGWWCVLLCLLLPLWAVLLFPFFCGDAFLSIVWVVVLFASLRLGGAAWSPLGGVAFPISFCVLLPSFSSSGWDYFSPVFCWVVLRCPSLFAWCCLSSPPFGGPAFLPSVGWCCCPKSKRKDAAKWKNEI